MSNERQVLMGGIRLGGSIIGGIRAHKWGNKASKIFSKIKFDNKFFQRIGRFYYEVI